MTYITGNKIALGYENKTVITELNFVIHEKDYICIYGENGAGKSTLLKALLGLKKLQEGTIRFDERLTQQDIGYLPQQGVIRPEFPTTVKELVESGCLNQMSKRIFLSKEQKQKAAVTMKEFGLWKIRRHSFQALSGGQKQRVLLARAVCAASKIIFLDEPVTGLDPEARKEMYRLIRQMNERGIAIVMVSHDIEESIQDATHVIWIEEGHHYYGTREDFMNIRTGGQLR